MIGVIKVAMWERRKIGQRYDDVGERMNRGKRSEISFFFFFFYRTKYTLAFLFHFSSFFLPNFFARSFTFLSSEFFLWQVVSCSIFCLTAMCLFQDVSSFSQFSVLPKFISCCYRELLRTKGGATVDETRSNVPRKDAYACNFAGDSTREITVTLTLERKDKARGVFLRIVFQTLHLHPYPSIYNASWKLLSSRKLLQFATTNCW